MVAVPTGDALVANIWGAIGVVVVFVAIIFIIFKFFIGAQRNIPAGLGCLVGVAVLAALASAPGTVLDIGADLVAIFTG